jgi:hypothetical protein
VEGLQAVSASGAIRAGKAFVELGVSDKLTAGLRRAQKRLKAFGAGLRSIGTRITAFGASLAAPLAASVKVFSSAGDQLDKMSKRTGVSVEALSELGFAAEQSGADLATLEAGIRIMQRTMGDASQGLATAVDAFAALGHSAEQLAGLSPEQQFTVIAERLSQIADPTARAAAAMDVFGKSGTKLLPLLSDGAKGMAELRDQARSLGLTVSTKSARDAALLTDTLNILWRVLKQGVFTIGSALAPVIVDVSNRITRVVVRVSEWIKQNKALVVTALKVTAAIVAGGIALVALGWLISGVAAAVGGLASVVAGIGAALGVVGSAVAAILSPMGLVISAAVALAGTLLVATEAGAEALAWLGDRFRALKDTVFKVIGGISDALAAGDIGLAAKILWLSLKLAWQEGVAALNRVWLEAKRYFLGTVQKMWYGALALSEQILHGLEVAWIETTAFLSKTWTSFTAGFKKAWNSAVNWTTKRLLELQGLLDDGFDVEAAKRMADEDLAATNTEIDRQRDAALAAREKQRQSERDSARELNEATLAEIGRQFDEAQKALDDETNTKVAATKQALADARKKLDEAIAAARAKREAIDSEPGVPRRKLTDPLSELEDRLAGLGDTIARKISVTGTFNPAAIAGLGGGMPRSAPPGPVNRLRRTRSVSSMPPTRAGSRSRRICDGHHHPRKVREPSGYDGPGPHGRVALHGSRHERRLLRARDCAGRIARRLRCLQRWLPRTLAREHLGRAGRRRTLGGHCPLQPHPADGRVHLLVRHWRRDAAHHAEPAKCGPLRAAGEDGPGL